MRDIKFRAWSLIEKKWLNPESIIIWCDGSIGKIDPHCWDGGVTTHEDYVGEKALVLMQYSNLKDKNGKEIYEGDIVTHHYFNENGIMIWHTGQSRWALEYLSDKTKQEMFPIDKDSFEIIGNLYENPELLKRHC